MSSLTPSSTINSRYGTVTIAGSNTGLSNTGLLTITGSSTITTTNANTSGYIYTPYDSVSFSKLSNLEYNIKYKGKYFCCEDCALEYEELE